MGFCQIEESELQEKLFSFWRKIVLFVLKNTPENTGASVGKGVVTQLQRAETTAAYMGT